MKVIRIIFLLLIFIGCRKENNNNLTTLNGDFEETSPVNGRSQVKFIDDNKVIIRKDGGSSEDEFNYEILNKTISLTPESDNSLTTELSFEIISGSKFIIGNLYPSIPENPGTWMTFEKADGFVNKTTDALIVGFVMEKCYCCWGWVIRVGKVTIKAEQIPNLIPSENTVFPIKAITTIGSKAIDCPDKANPLTILPDYYEIKECILIR